MKYTYSGRGYDLGL